VPPKVHVAVVLVVPGVVVLATLQVQDTFPSDPAVGLVFKPDALDLLPDGQVTVIRHVAPGKVWASMVADPPRGAGSGNETNATAKPAAGGATDGAGVAGAVGPAGCVVDGGLVDELPVRAMA
jgi:hypothetical protein